MPKVIVTTLTFSNVLKLAFRLSAADIDCQKFAVRLLYALRASDFGAWVSDWHHDVLLGYCCQLAGRYDEQFAFYEEARSNAITQAAPAGLMIALAKCAFLPDPSVTFEQAIGWLEGVLKQEIYLDALELLLSIYRTIDQPSKAADVERRLEKARSHDVYSELPLPPCVNEKFDEPLTRSE